MSYASDHVNFLEGVDTRNQRESVRLIREALREEGYRAIKEVRLSNKGSKPDVLIWYSLVTATQVYTCLLQLYEDGQQGCELFVQATTENSTEKTIQAIPKSV